MTAALPRVVVVTRPTDYALLLLRHATRAQAAFFLQTRGQRIAELEAQNQRFEQARAEVLRAIPDKWRRSVVGREDLDRFVFEPEDLVVALGQDGLVANMAKYLHGQTVLGINPDPGLYDGVLARHLPADARALLLDAHGGRLALEERTMVEARLDDGQRLLALNEVFAGHRSHQSARYRIRCGELEERHSSSGVIVATGTGATGWACSIARQRSEPLALPAPADPRLVFFVREAFPSVATGTRIGAGELTERAALQLTSELNAGGVIFGDGIEEDYLEFGWGVTASIGVAAVKLHLAA